MLLGEMASKELFLFETSRKREINGWEEGKVSRATTMFFLVGRRRSHPK